MLSVTQPQFSLYDRIDRQDASSIFVEEIPLLQHWSRSIETAVLELEIAADMAVGFQEIRLIEAHMPRYRRLHEVVRSVTVFGLPGGDIDLGGLSYAALRPGDALSKEWFVIVKHPDYHRALIARELDDANHSFEGILTSDPAQVAAFYDALMMVIQQRA